MVQTTSSTGGFDFFEFYTIKMTIDFFMRDLYHRIIGIARKNNTTGGGRKMKRILLACSAGVATSTVVINRLNKAMESRGLKGQYMITQCKVGEVAAKQDTYDFVVATTQMPSLKIDIIYGVPLLTGIGAEAIWDDIARRIRD